MNLAPRPGLAAIDAPRALHFRHMVFAAEVATTCGRIRFFVCTPAFSRFFVPGSFSAPLPLALPLPHARQLSAATDCWQRHTAPVDLHRTALDAHAHQCFAALAVKMQMNTAQSGSTACGLCWSATLVLGAQNGSAARGLCWGNEHASDTVTRCSAAALTGQGMQTVTHKHTAVPPPCGANVTQTVALQTCTAPSTLPPSASVARDAGRTERFRSARALLARDAVLCDSSSRAHGPWLTEAHAMRVCTLDRNGQVEAIAHLCSVRPPQRRARRRVRRLS